MLTAIAIALVLVFLCHGFNFRKRFNSRHLPGPTPEFMFGNLRQMMKGSMPLLHSWAQKYGSCYCFFIASQPIVVLSDPELVKEVAVKQFMNFHDRPTPEMIDFGFDKKMDSIRFDGILLAQGKFWAGLRATMEPLFHSSSLQSFVPLMNKCADALVRGLTIAGDGNRVNIGALLKGMTMDVMGTTAFGVEFDALKPPGHPVSELIYHCQYMLKPSNPVMSMRLLHMLSPSFRWLWRLCAKVFGHQAVTRWDSMTRAAASRGYLWGVSQAMLESIRSQQSQKGAGDHTAEKGHEAEVDGMASDVSQNTNNSAVETHTEENGHHRSDDTTPTVNGNCTTSAYDLSAEELRMGWLDAAYQYKRRAMAKYRGSIPQANTLLYRLASAVHKETQQPLTDEQICAQSNTMLVAGYETTSTALTYTLYLLAQHPEVQQKVVEEVDRVIGDGETGSKQLQDLPYTNAVFQEAMRVYTPVTPLFALNRQCIQSCKVGDWFIPKGFRVIMNCYTMHRDPKHFPEPEVFRPERFLADSPEAQSRHPYAYQPFGFGPRKCVGYKFAMQEAILALAKIFKNFTFSLPPGSPEKLEVTYGIIMMPKHDVELIVHARK